MAATDMAKRREIWYTQGMPKRSARSGKNNTGFVVGNEECAKISAAEGIRLKPAIKARAAEASRDSLSADEPRDGDYSRLCEN
jgi:hypothetical protein